MCVCVCVWGGGGNIVGVYVVKARMKSRDGDNRRERNSYYHAPVTHTLSNRTSIWSKCWQNMHFCTLARFVHVNYSKAQNRQLVS